LNTSVILGDKVGEPANQQQRRMNELRRIVLDGVIEVNVQPMEVLTKQNECLWRRELLEDVEMANVGIDTEVLKTSLRSQ